MYPNGGLAFSQGKPPHDITGDSRAAHPKDNDIRYSGILVGKVKLQHLFLGLPALLREPMQVMEHSRNVVSPID